MQPPIGVTIYETTISRHWLDADGIVCSVSKPGERSKSLLKETVAIYAQLTAQKKACLLADSTHSGAMSKELREYLVSEIPLYFKAIAVLSKKPLQAALTNVFIKLNFKRFPVKLFTNEREARAWLKEYM